MIFPFTIYTYELKWRCFYISSSFIICLLILFNYFENIILLQVFPLIKFEHRRLVSFYVTELFNTFIFSIIFIVMIFIFIFIKYHIYSFFSSSWFLLQLQVFHTFFYIFWFLFIIIYNIVHFFLLPRILYFFLLWELKNTHSLIQIEANSQVINYVSWIIVSNLWFTTLVVFLIFFIVLLVITFGPFLLFTILCTYKRTIIYIFFCTCLFLTSFDIISQFFILLLIFIFFEINIFLLCYFIITRI